MKGVEGVEGVEGSFSYRAAVSQGGALACVFAPLDSFDVTFFSPHCWVHLERTGTVT